MQTKNNPYLEILRPAFIIVALIIVVAIYGFINYTGKSIEIAKTSWVNFSGAEVTNWGVHFNPLGRIITHQDGSAGQPNPPVNFSGQHLKVTGDFKITATLSEIDGLASFRMYAEIPVVYDKWRLESKSININVDKINNLVTAHIWDGSSSTPIDMRIYKVFLTSKTIISVEHVEDEIIIIVNNHLFSNMPDHNIFDSGNIWFGASGAVGGSGWTLNKLSAEVIGAGSVEVISPPTLIVEQDNKKSLRNLADANPRKIKIGAAISVGQLFVNEQYKKLALSQFSIMTPENSMKPQFIHPEQNTYVFEEADLLVNAALENKMIVHGHVLVYDKSTPDWMNNIPKEQRQEIMTSHIKNVVSHFKGNVAEWDVINEPFSGKQALYKNNGTGLEPNIWFEAMGEEYIDIAFKTAHQADPLAKLYLNDFGLERDGQHWDALISLIKRLKNRGVPIDGIGFESHIYNDGDYINPDQFKKHMEILASLGLQTRISEIDVTGDDAKEQANQYVTALDVCLRSANCTSYTTWGITDLYGSTTKSDRYPPVYGTSLLWDKEMKAKPAYEAIQKRLEYAY